MPHTRLPLSIRLLCLLLLLVHPTGYSNASPKTPPLDVVTKEEPETPSEELSRDEVARRMAEAIGVPVEYFLEKEEDKIRRLGGRLDRDGDGEPDLIVEVEPSGKTTTREYKNGKLFIEIIDDMKGSYIHWQDNNFDGVADYVHTSERKPKYFEQIKSDSDFDGIFDTVITRKVQNETMWEKMETRQNGMMKTVYDQPVRPVEFSLTNPLEPLHRKKE